MKKIVQIVLILLCVASAGFFLSGCKQNTIEFYRESKASTFMKDLNMQNNTNSYQNGSSGVIKLHDDQQSSGGINFGPSDINFGSSR